MKYGPLNDLIHAIPTSRLLLQKAHNEGALIEGLCLYVSTIDALLRLALVYSRTQKAPNYTYSIPKELIRQDEGEKTYREKEIYAFAFKEKVISDDLNKRLYEMYDYRNRVVPGAPSLAAVARPGRGLHPRRVSRNDEEKGQYP
jgi:hypothetical protein